MSNNVAVEFTVGQTNNIEAEYTVEQSQAIETEFTINITPTKVSELENDLEYQTRQDLETALEGKQDVLTEGTGITIEDNVISATATSAEWGLITGDIDDQTDLKDALDAKEDVISDLSEIRSGAEKGETALQSGDNVSELANNAGYITSSALSGYATENYVDTADQNLQGQIDAIVASSDVFDIVGTYAELQAYDISTVPVNDIIKVLVDSTHENAATYYRCVETGGVKSWSYIGTEGAYYTKAQSDTRFATSAQGALADTAVQPSDLATVATTGSYNDLLNKPTIPDTTYMVTTNTAQTISANKTFHNAELITDNMITLNGSTSFLRGLKGIEYRNLIKLNSSGITAGSINEALTLNGSGTRPKYNSSDVALYSDIPTVNDATITITQGGVSKGSITLNQATDQTIALDAGGGGGGSYTAGTGIDITSDVISVTAPTLTNTATGTNSLTILGYTTSQQGCVNIGNGSATNNSTFATAIGQNASIGNSAGNSVAIGSSASVTTSSQYATAVGVSSNCRAERTVAIGYSASARASYAIQLGYGTNSEANSFYVSTSSSNNWKMLGSDGLIPAARIAIDGTSITINGSGQLQASGGGGSYTAGDGIIIQNDEISVDAEATDEVDVESITEVTIGDLLKLITGYDANATQTLKNINGSIQWVTD